MLRTTASQGRRARTTTFRVAALLCSVALGLAVVCSPFALPARADPPKQVPKKESKAVGTPSQKARPVAAPKELAKNDAGGPALAPPHATPAASGHEVVERESRIEFDERMVRGQSAAGSIFLFQRAPSEFKSIVEVPEGFRAKTVELVQPRPGTP
jgi:hypothetical protein